MQTPEPSPDGIIRQLLKQAASTAKRNGPCPCGSGRKFKQCCEGKTDMGTHYQVDGVTLSEAAVQPERIQEMRSYELYATRATPGCWGSLLFEIESPENLRLTDLILRRGLDRRLAGSWR